MLCLHSPSVSNVSCVWPLPLFNRWQVNIFFVHLYTLCPLHLTSWTFVLYQYYYLIYKITLQIFTMSISNTPCLNHIFIQRFFALLWYCFLHVLWLHSLAGGRVGSPRWSHDSAQLPDMMDLSEYHPLYQQLGLPRRLGIASMHEQPAQDMVYR